MSAVLPTGAEATPLDRLREALAHLLHSWRSLHWREAGWFLWFGGLIAGMNALALADSDLLQQRPALLFTETLMPVLCGLLLMLAWLPADRSAADHPRRPWRIAAAVVAASGVVALVLSPLLDALGWPSVMDVAYAAKGMPPPGWVAGTVAGFLSMLVPSGLMLALVEMASRHRHTQQVLARAQHEQAALQRSTSSRAWRPCRRRWSRSSCSTCWSTSSACTARRMARAQGASQQMERLITYLRVALPRLRESGSTLGAEVDLLASYLDLVQAMRGGRPHFSTALPAALRDATFHPMLLLPLVQRAVRSSGPPPEHIVLRAETAPGLLRLTLDLAAPDLCRHDPELQRLQDRLQVLYAGRAALRCEERPPASTTPASP